MTGPSYVTWVTSGGAETCTCGRGSALRGAPPDPTTAAAAAAEPPVQSQGTWVAGALPCAPAVPTACLCRGLCPARSAVAPALLVVTAAAESESRGELSVLFVSHSD